VRRIAAGRLRHPPDGEAGGQCRRAADLRDRAGFVEAYKRSLAAKGYAVRQLPATAAITECPMTSTYTANWRWDMAMYMVAADIKVYSNGRPVGEAKYDSLHGGANMNKFIDADRKIDELVNQLFPGGAGS
jgi:hypothetical protein